MKAAIELLKNLLSSSGSLPFIVGVLVILIGASNGIKIGNFEYTIPNDLWRSGLSVVGILLAGIGAWLIIAQRSTSAKRGEIKVDISEFNHNNPELRFRYRDLATVDGFLDRIWREGLRLAVPQQTYGSEWVLSEKQTGHYRHDLGARATNSTADRRTLEVAGLHPAMELAAVSPKQILFIDPSPVLGGSGENIAYRFTELGTVEGLLNRIGNELLKGRDLTNSNYGEKWVLYNMETGQYLDNLNERKEETLAWAGINEGMRLQILRPPLKPAETNASNARSSDGVDWKSLVANLITLSHDQWSLFQYVLGQRGKYVGLAQLGEIVRLTDSDVYYRLEALVNLRLIEKRSDAADRRSSYRLPASLCEVAPDDHSVSPSTVTGRSGNWRSRQYPPDDG
jgi:hypothetical protein